MNMGIWQENPYAVGTISRTTDFVYVIRIWMFKVRRCVLINEIEIGIFDEIERLSSWHEIEWQIRVVKLNEYRSKLNEI